MRPRVVVHLKMKPEADGGRHAPFTEGYRPHFVIPPDDVPEEVREAVKHWSQWIDYWSVDWDHKGDTFTTSGKPSARGRTTSCLWKSRTLTTSLGEYRVVVKVIDILGNDTTKTVKVKVK